MVRFARALWWSPLRVVAGLTLVCGPWQGCASQPVEASTVSHDSAPVVEAPDEAVEAAHVVISALDAWAREWNEATRTPVGSGRTPQDEESLRLNPDESPGEETVETFDESPFHEEVRSLGARRHTTHTSWLDEVGGGEFALLLGGNLARDWPDQRPRETFPSSEGFGSVNAWGFTAELSGHWRIRGDEQTSLWLGGRIGSMNWDERRSFAVVLPNNEVVDDDVHANILLLAPSVKLRQRFNSRLHGFVGGGAGAYFLTLSEEEDFYGSDELADDTTIGGFLSAGIDFLFDVPFSLRLEQQVHFARFDSLDEFSPGNDSISGPFWVTALGFVGRF